MRIAILGVAFVLGSILAACTDPEEEDLGTFSCGAHECDVRSEVCATPDSCDGSNQGDPTCAPVPEACDGTASRECLDVGCDELEDGGFACSPVCG